MSSPTPNPPEDASRSSGKARRYWVIEILTDADTKEVLHAHGYPPPFEVLKDYGLAPSWWKDVEDARRAEAVLGGEAQEQEAPLGEAR